MVIYIVEPGDTVYSISRKFGVDTARMCSNNGISLDSNLSVGQAIVIMFPLRTHTVRTGDTLYSIAGEAGTTVLQLYRNNIELNGLDNINVGQILVTEYERSPLGGYSIGGYAYPFVNQELLTQSLPFMGILVPFTYGFTPEGELVPLDDAEMLLAASNYDTKAYMHLSTLTPAGNFSTELANVFLADSSKWETLYNNILDNMQAKGYIGLDIDFEYLGLDNSVLYAEFVAYMRERLNAEGYYVIVALAPKTYDEQPGDLYEGHDYALLGEAANYVLLMTYEWGYTTGPPLPIAPLPNVRQVIEYALTRIPNYKIFLGIPNYGYNFSIPFISGESRAPSVSTAQAIELANRYNAEIMFDDYALSPYFFFTSIDGQEHVVYFEDARSIEAKLMLMEEYELFGGLYWNLMRQNDQNLLMLNYYIEYGN